MHEAFRAPSGRIAASSGSSLPPPSGLYFLVHISLLNGLLFYNQGGLTFVGKPRVIRYGLTRDALCVRAAALPDSGMCLAFNQKRQCTPDRSVHTRAAPVSNMTHKTSRLCFWSADIWPMVWFLHLGTRLWCFHAAAVKPKWDYCIHRVLSSVIHLRLVLNGCSSLRSVRALQQVALFIKPKRLMMRSSLKAAR